MPNTSRPPSTSPINKAIVALVEASARHAVAVIIFSILMAILCGWYAAGHIAINTDVNQLLSADLPWRKQEKSLEQAFPQRVDTLLVVVDGDNADIADYAASTLATTLQQKTNLFTSVTRPDNIPFFRQNGLLFLPRPEIASALDAIVQAQPMLGTMVSDPSLRGFFSMLDMMGQGVRAGAMDRARFDKPLDAVSASIEAALKGEIKPVPWQSLMTDHQPNPHELRKFILTKPVLDYSALQPGAAASEAVRKAVQDLHLTADNGVHIRLTGSVPLSDEEFGSVAEGTSFATSLSGVLVVVILLLALRSLKLIIPIIITLIVGLVATTAFALAVIGSLNLISVAFAVMFIGIAVDFGIQFGVRYRDQRHLEPNHQQAMTRTAHIIATPLAMAAASTALGFLAFIPTDYRGVSELGIIAGAGMIIAFFLNVTLLPALLTIFRPAAEMEAVGYAWAKPIDLFILEHRRVILAIVGVIAILAMMVTSSLRFDFDPLNLKDQKTESVSTLFDLMKDPDFGFDTVELLRPSLDEAEKIANELRALPQVDHVITLASFVPEEQDGKLALVSDTAMLMSSTFALPQNPEPSSADILASLNKASAALATMPEDQSALRLSRTLSMLTANPSPEVLATLKASLIGSMQNRLDGIRMILSATTITPDTITDDLRQDWVSKDGFYRVQVYPKGNTRNHHILTTFTEAVRKIAPDATGAPISIQESGKTVTQAFIHAGLYALAAIAILALLVLRRPWDVARLLMPLILAGILTLATIVVIDLPLNFANIIALPLLLSLGVSYAIYFVSYWQSGQNHPLQSSMGRAVLFSAATTLVAFGTLALSSHPGTAGMGELLTVALLYSLICTFFVLPALLGSAKGDRRE